MRHLAALATVVCMSGLLFSIPAAEASSADAEKYINNIAKQALNTISNAKLSKTQKQASLDKLFRSSVDMKWVARFVMGRFWRQATDDQKSRYVKEYEKFLLHHYTSRFTDYTSGSFTLTGTRDDGEHEYTVSMELSGNGKKNEPPVLVDYRVREEDGGFKIFDVIVEGVSLITTQRSEFAAVITQHDIEYLITQLKNRSLPDTKTPR